ncbi:SMI1/KNR4 family protein [Anditalea andensis]|uniref:Knr4/Smi1-like domain-containing protein n=1 Tax=Anditalea andensis TaxID=1048983 RepID=A0A074LCY7_9BACT|nr:SMI1/KNR4 family protein [Anditalea andensis]KEO71622.1 hypothetical protein EL17_24050 [Anditalea andensis]
MMQNYSEIHNLVFKFENLGTHVAENGAILIGKAPFLGREAWLNKIYPSLTHEEILELETSLNQRLPVELKSLLNEFSNGLNILSSTLSIYGLRKQLGRSIEASRQPFSILTPNKLERPSDSKDSFLFIGGYNWDGSLLYIDIETSKIHCCTSESANSKFCWKTLDEMLISEIKRLYTLFDENGKELKEGTKTIPY